MIYKSRIYFKDNNLKIFFFVQRSFVSFPRLDPVLKFWLVYEPRHLRRPKWGNEKKVVCATLVLDKVYFYFYCRVWYTNLVFLK